MSTDRIQTTVIGSYPIPSWLAAFPSAGNLRDAILVVLKTQELAGLDVISDGELSRFNVNHPETNGMIEYFVAPLGNVDSRITRQDSRAFTANPAMHFRARPAGVVRGPINEGTLDLPAAWNSVRTLTKVPLKFTVTSPYMLARTLLDERYQDPEKLTRALAEVLAAQVAQIDAPVVQIDEANLPGRPQDAPWAAEAINLVLRQARGKRGVHLCFGNYGGQSIQKGFWRDLIPFFNSLEADHLLLETARRDPAELDVFRGLRPGLALGIGVVDIKTNEVESSEAIARAIERAAAVLGQERVRWIHPDCGFWMLPRTVADRKMRALVAGRDLFYGS